MSTRLLFLSDTHVPNRAKVIPAQVWAAVDKADVVFHAGDWVSVDLLDALEARAARLLGVYGNNDGPELRERLPETATATIEGIRWAMIHETGAAQGREARSEAKFPDTDVLIFGHSHIPWDSTGPHGLRLLNPGSPTDRRRQPVGTFLTAVADAGRLREVTLVPLKLEAGGQVRKAKEG
ncbi:metallophosphoesterase [Paenarthrobacter sp. Z7-10]|uniref:metallophosphoesterase family protein n=1 Tax=Paenarthrobacter sp. Z7-10 TaxID=2787635 RepID=UPI0022A970C7|nr:metallophosphoesterase [Paenarthrobacter sp. Z7-10]MCZ2401626.1 metallophosphoesterase [Paenarthrobacter sp. Z7-10]